MRPTAKQQESLKKPKPRAFSWQGFTLAELLISLLILAEIATFSIPKILSAQQASTKRAQAKEVAAMIAAAHQKLQLEGGGVTTATTSENLRQYFNFLAVDTTSTIDRETNLGAFACSHTWVTCLKLHTGGILLYDNTVTLASSGYTSWFLYDPDGTYSGATTGQGKGISFSLYLNGRLLTTPANHPPWFSW